MLFWSVVIAVLIIVVTREWLKGRPIAEESVVNLKSGGVLIAEVLKNHEVDTIYCLSGGHVAPVYCEAERVGIRVIDVRHEVNAAFAADAYARLSGKPGVACVTAGPGVTNTTTAIQNAKMAESPLILLGGATSIILKGRGSLQDIDHMALMKSLVKWSASPSCIADVVPALEEAFKQSQAGVPGPVFVELPMDLLYHPEQTLKQATDMMPKVTNTSVSARLTRWYIYRYLNGIFKGAGDAKPKRPVPVVPTPPQAAQLQEALALLAKAHRPVLVIGSQAMLVPGLVDQMIDTVLKLNVPVYLAGMARGLLGNNHPSQLHMRHNRTKALKSADFVMLLGVVCDFRMQYGEAINSRAKLVTVNRSTTNAYLNWISRYPKIAAICDPASFLVELGRLGQSGASAWVEWKDELRASDAAKEQKISDNAATEPKGELLNPVHLCKEVQKVVDDDSMLVVDGGDFVGTAAYTVVPRKPLSWLDPGQFGTLGVGGGFALAAKTVRPDAEVWVMYGDGALGFSIAEFDTFARQKMGIIAVVGNDAGWTQIVRDQIRFLKSSAACKLAPTDYHIVADGFGGKGFLLNRKEDIPQVLAEAKKVAKTGVPVLINCMIARNDFREGSISM